MTSETTLKGYLTGNAKHWFWGAGAVLLWMFFWTAASPALYSTLLERANIRGSANIVLIAAGIQTFLHVAAWVMMGLSFGLHNKVKAFKIMFLVVAGVQLAGCYSHFLSNFAVSHILYARGTVNPAAITYARVMSLLLNGAWVVFALIAICHKRTGAGLRAASIALLAARVLSLVYRYGQESFFRQLADSRGTQTAVTAIGLTGLGMNVLIYGSLIWFFGAMAFSRMREADAY